MQTTLDVSVNGRRLRFHSDFALDQVDSNGGVIKSGSWESYSGESENELTFRFDGEARISLAATYQFNGRNQLVIQIPKQPGIDAASNAWTLQGRISIDDNRDVIYVLIDEQGSLTDRKIFIYGNLDFLKSTDRLSVKFQDGTETFIVGNDGKKSLEASNYFQGGDLARDLLWFDAVTTNNLNGEDFVVPAEIQFVGRWDLYENALVFVTSYDPSGTVPKASISIGGEIKGTNFGLVVEQNGSIALQIQGRYRWNQSDLGWELSLGHSPNNILKGKLVLAGNLKGKNGNLKINGSLQLSKNQQQFNIELNLGLTYTAKWGSLDFQLTSNGQTYQLYFGGEIRVSQGKVTFALKFSNSGGAKKAEAEFGYYTRDIGLKLALESVLGRGGSGMKVKMNFKFAVSWSTNGLLEPV